MQTVGILPKNDAPLTILCLGAHSDDIEIGCGGTILRLLSEYTRVEIHWIVFSSNSVRNAEAIDSANKFLIHSPKKNIIVENFKDGFFPYVGEEIKKFFENLKHAIDPDIIFTHYRHDLHQDHRLISELTWNTFRDHLILEYEIMKYDGDLGHPNFFVQLDDKTCQKKVAQILESFKSQASHRWFSKDAFFSLLRLRGIECNAAENYAEGFYCRKITI